MARTSGLAVLPPLGANACLTCRCDHEQLDQFWACPKHGHKLKKLRDDGDFEQYACPAYRCMYVRSAPRKPRSPSQGDPMTTVQTRPSVALDAMWGNSKRLAALLPEGIEVNLFIASAASALYNNADLMACAERNPASLMIALTDCAGLGHLPGTKHYYLTPRGLKNSKRGPEVLGIEGYQGIIDRYYRSGEVRKVVVREVCAGDYFRYVEGEDEHPIHRFSHADGTTGADFFGPQGSVDRGPMVGVYCAVQSVDGHWYRPAILSRDDVLAARDSGGYSPTDPHNPWNRYDAGKDQPGFQGRSMWWKTAAKRAEPWTPTSSEDKRQRARAQAIPQPAAAAMESHASAPALPAAGPRGNGQQALPVARKADPAVIEATGTAIGKQFDRLGLEDGDEREFYVRKLNQDAEGELTEHQLRFALGALGECEDLAALVDLCSPEPEAS